MTSHRAVFDAYDVIVARNVHLSDDSIVDVIKKNFINVEMMVKDKIKRNHIKDALYVPKLQTNLLSVNKFLLNGLKMQFNLNELYCEKSRWRDDCHGSI